MARQGYKKILLPRLYAETLVSARFLCAESDLLGFTFGNELVPLSGYVDHCAHKNCWLQWPGLSEVTKNLSFVWMTSRAWPGGRWRCSPTVVTCTSNRDESTSPTPLTSKTGSLLYCGMTADHRLTLRSSTLPPAASSTCMSLRPAVVSSPCHHGAKQFCSDPKEVPPQSEVSGEHSREM